MKVYVHATSIPAMSNQHNLNKQQNFKPTLVVIFVHCYVDTYNRPILPLPYPSLQTPLNILRRVHIINCKPTIHLVPHILHYYFPIQTNVKLVVLTHLKVVVIEGSLFK